MEKRRILVTNGGQEENFRAFFGESIDRILYVPFAVPINFRDQYMEEVREKMDLLGYQIDSVHEERNPKKAVKEAQGIVITGGNTHLLLKEMYDANLVKAIRDKVKSGMPIVGKSAGAGVLCPTIKTSNDWAIVDSPSLDAIVVLPFQINPHFPEFGTPGYQGRANHIDEFQGVSDTPVVGLIDSANLYVQGNMARLYGPKGVELFLQGELPRGIAHHSDLSFLLENK